MLSDPTRLTLPTLSSSHQTSSSEGQPGPRGTPSLHQVAHLRRRVLRRGCPLHENHVRQLAGQALHEGIVKNFPPSTHPSQKRQETRSCREQRHEIRSRLHTRVPSAPRTRSIKPCCTPHQPTTPQHEQVLGTIIYTSDQRGF